MIRRNQTELCLPAFSLHCQTHTVAMKVSITAVLYDTVPTVPKCPRTHTLDKQADSEENSTFLALLPLSVMSPGESLLCASSFRCALSSPHPETSPACRRAPHPGRKSSCCAALKSRKTPVLQKSASSWLWSPTSSHGFLSGKFSCPAECAERQNRLCLLQRHPQDRSPHRTTVSSGPTTRKPATSFST